MASFSAPIECAVHVSLVNNRLTSADLESKSRVLCIIHRDVFMPRNLSIPVFAVREISMTEFWRLFKLNRSDCMAVFVLMDPRSD